MLLPQSHDVRRYYIQYVMERGSTEDGLPPTWRADCNISIDVKDGRFCKFVSRLCAREIDVCGLSAIFSCY